MKTLIRNNSHALSWKNRVRNHGNWGIADALPRILQSDTIVSHLLPWGTFDCFTFDLHLHSTSKTRQCSTDALFKSIVLVGVKWKLWLPPPVGSFTLLSWRALWTADRCFRAWYGYLCLTLWWARPRGRDRFTFHRCDVGEVPILANSVLQQWRSAIVSLQHKDWEQGIRIDSRGNPR